jgi:[CysO sulfur-carrier protein]-S-L-cysteine hydrolase
VADAADGDGERAPRLPGDLGDVVRHLESTWPREGCGVLLRQGARGPWRCRPLRNVQDDLHAQDARRFPRTSRDAYAFDPREWLGVLLEAERRGEDVVCVFHSHVEGPADFSPEDRRQAAPTGQPLLPGVSYLVVAIHSGCASQAALFGWEDGRFRRWPLPSRKIS